ncbi:MAG: hypothetical protein RBT71_04925 [Flavobacteriales bacterium]|jgi:hypothetical protein|nr:hypothetical protein [Flavobacteriales bacterium]
MSRLLWGIVLLLAALPSAGQGFTLRVDAPAYPGQAVLVYTYLDLFTRRTERLATALPDSTGSATVSGPATGTQKLRIRVGETYADLYVRPGSRLHVRYGLPEPGTPRSMSGTTPAVIELLDLDPLDINALTSDLNQKLDDFLMEDLATDRAGGMQALDLVRRGEAAPDTMDRPPTLFVTPNMSSARLDTFETRLRHFYRGIDDPWFADHLTYGVAGMRLGPRANDRALYERLLRDRPIDTTNPEQVRFIRGFFTELLGTFALRHHEAATLRALAMPTADSLKAVFARHDFLRDNDALAELVMLDQLYTHNEHPGVQRADVLRLIADVATRSAHPAHRTIAANMHWDLTTMQRGGTLPAMRLTDLNGRAVDIDTMLNGATCIFITAGWCTWCDLELTGLAQLDRTYNGIIPVTVISLDTALADAAAHRARHEGHFRHWLHAPAELQLREDLRIRTLPAIYLLNDDRLEWAPAPLPSDGLGAIFHRTRTEAREKGRTKVWDD